MVVHHQKSMWSGFFPFAEQFQRILKPKGSLILNIKENADRGERHIYVLELILEMKKNGWLWVEDYIWHKKTYFGQMA